jgi:hypothetical protein
MGKARQKLSSLTEGFILFFTVVGVVALGILAAYGAVIAILNTVATQFGRPTERKVLVTSQAQAAHAGGD